MNPKPQVTEAEVASWPTSLCEKCGLPYPRHEAWARTCLVCFKKGRSLELLKGDFNFLWSQLELEKARKSLLDATKEIERLKAAAPAANATDFSSIDPDLLKQMIALCHPDRHDNSERATRVTQYLLSMRDKTKQKG